MDGFFFIFIMIIGVILVNYLILESRNTRKEVWRQLTVENRLEFIPARDFFGGAFVAGLYQGHGLRLETYQKSHGKSSYTYTRLTISVNFNQRRRRFENQNETISTLVETSAAPLLKQLYQTFALRGKVTTDTAFRHLYYEQRGLEADITYLSALFDYMVQLVDLYQLVSWGGEVMPDLQEIATQKGHNLRDLAKQLIYDIGRQTRGKFSLNPRQIICPHCLTRYSAHTVDLSWWESVTYYGCRMCGQSRDFLNITQTVVATLDKEMQANYLQENGHLRVNWLTRRQLFDFDSVEIIKANDEEVERFAVQVGNDTDPTRRPHYKRIPSVIASHCQLSENSKRILDQMFGEVKMAL